jgi:TolA-binding protein
MGAPLIRHEFHTALERSKVDAHNGIIYGVSLITGGITARGHELEVDHKTVSQLKECAEKRGTVPVKWNHRSGADAVCGYLDNFRVEGVKLLGDWHLLKTHPNYAQAIELAERMPNNIGLSAAFMGEDEARGGKKFARASELVSVDLVSTPAANPDGLFEEKVDTREFDRMNDQTNVQSEGQPTLADVIAAIEGMAQQMQSMSETITDLQGFQDAVLEAANQEQPEEEQEEQEGEHEEGDGQFEGQGESEGASASVGTALSRRISALENLKMREFAAAEEAQHHELSSSVNNKVDFLISRNTELSAENEALRYAFRTRGAGVLSHNGHAERMFEANTPKQHLFEQHVSQLVSEGMNKGKAIAFAQKEDPQSYVNYLAAKGIVKLQD